MKRFLPAGSVLPFLAIFLAALVLSETGRAQTEAAPLPASNEAPGPADLAAAPGPALAQDVELEAERLFEEGNRAYDKGDFTAARASYKASFSLRPSFEVAGNWAQADEKQGRFVEAAEHLSYALVHAPKDLPEAQRLPMQTMMAALRDRIGVVALSVPTAGVAVLVDGVLVGTGPFEDELFREAGAWISMEAHLPGCLPDAQRERLEAGERVEAQLAPTCPDPTPHVAPTGPPVAPTVRTLATPPPARAAPPMQDGGPDAFVLGAGAGLATAAVVTGLGLTTTSLQHEDDADTLAHELLPLGPLACQKRPSACDEVAASRRASDVAANGAAVAYALAGLLAAGTVGYAIWWEDWFEAPPLTVRVDRSSVALTWSSDL